MKQYAIILLADNTLPGGGVRTLTSWPGGKIRSVTGNAVTPLYFTYGVNAQSNLWVCGTSGSENSGADTVSYFDPAGRTKYIEYADELFDTYGYDILGRMTNLLDRTGRTARYGWDDLSNPLSVENEIGDDFAKVTFGFDKPSLTESITNQLDQQIMLSTRDIPGRKITERDIEGQDKITRFLAGERVATITRRDGVLVSNVWNAAGNLIEVRYDDDPQLYISWRADELPLQMSNTTSNVSWSYDEYGRPFIETQETLSGTFSATVSNTLNSAALPSQVTVCDASGSEVLACAYGYDSAERISTVTPQLPASSSSPSPVSYTYDTVHGLPSEVDGDVLDAEHSYNLLGQVTNITYRKNAGGTVVSSFDYQYNAAGMITNKQSIVDSVQSTVSYTYDELNRLTSETLTPITPSGSPSSTLYTYDLAGNRLTAGNSTFTYSNNKLNGVLHDAAGNITNMVQDGVTLDLTWNVQGQLISVNTNGVFAESYQYSPLGRRISTTTLTPNPSGSPIPNTVYHVYDGDQCVADVDDSGNLLLSYTWGVGIDNLLAVSVHGAGETNSYYAVKDHLNSVYALVDESGNVVNTFSYDAWGTPFNSSFSIHNSSLHLRYLFQGREYSVATGLYNFRARWYASDIGRWLSPDPIGLEGGLNLYEFCGNNSVNFLDPEGEMVGYVAVAVVVVAYIGAYIVDPWIEVNSDPGESFTAQTRGPFTFYGPEYNALPDILKKATRFHETHHKYHQFNYWPWDISGREIDAWEAERKWLLMQLSDAIRACNEEDVNIISERISVITLMLANGAELLREIYGTD